MLVFYDGPISTFHPHLLINRQLMWTEQTGLRELVNHLSSTLATATKHNLSRTIVWDQRSEISSTIATFHGLITGAVEVLLSSRMFWAFKE